MIIIFGFVCMYLIIKLFVKLNHLKEETEKIINELILLQNQRCQSVCEQFTKISCDMESMIKIIDIILKFKKEEKDEV